MPRSGTSLIDQIIDAHPRASGVGELASIERFAIQLSTAWDPEKDPPACFGKFDAFRWTRAAKAYLKEIQTHAPDADRIVNKALGNNKLVGLIACLFPNTRIIHAIRDPRDVAISCFMGGFNNNLHPWTTQMEWAARAWDQSARMMEHWKSSLDVPILDVHYEKLVRDPEHEFPRIIEFLGLDWDEACREFHKSRRTVRTLSYDQCEPAFIYQQRRPARELSEAHRGCGVCGVSGLTEREDLPQRHGGTEGEIGREWILSVCCSFMVWPLFSSCGGSLSSLCLRVSVVNPLFCHA